MQILIVAATEFEIASFRNAKPSADFLITGIGSAISVYHILKRLQKVDYDLVIQAGIAGSFTESLQLGEIVFVQEDNFADLGISEKNFFSTIFEKGFAMEDEFPFTNGWLKNQETLMNIFPLKKVRGITVNKVTDNKEWIRELQLKYDPGIETMEGAALHYTCLFEKIPFIQVRAISNYIGERDKNKWEMKKAIQNLNKFMLKIMNHLTI